MVAMENASLAHYLEASKSARSIEARRRLADAMVTAGATKPENAMPMARIKNGDWGLSRAVLYDLLRTSPGFAPKRHDVTGQLYYWFQADQMQEHAKKQGEAHYPIDLVAVGMELFKAGEPDNALWEVAEEKGEVAYFTAPYRQAGPETLEQFKPLLKDYADQLDNPLVRRLIIGVLGGIEVAEREGLD